MGEQHETQYERMETTINGTLIGAAESAGGGNGCASMVPVVPRSDSPLPPSTINLPAGVHKLTIETTTGDRRFHYGAYYELDLTLQ